MPTATATWAQPPTVRGSVVARYVYTAFGTRTALEGGHELAGPVGFCGALGIRPEAGGLLDMRARLYDPLVGRFISPDPWPAYLPEPVTFNRYLYALGDPISQVDPYGLFCWTGKNKHGKCRGLRDVADVVEEPLSAVSKVAGGVAAIAAGVTAVCPVPCGPISGAIAGWAGSVSFYTGIGAGVANCIDEGITTFGCATSAAWAAVSGASRPLFKTAARAAESTSQELARMIRFGGGIFGLFRSGAGSAAGRVKK